MKKLFLILLFLFVAGFYKNVNAYSVFVDTSGMSHDAGISSWLKGLGNTVTTVNDYKGENLNGYDIVMDFGYDYWTGFGNHPAKYNAYKQYLQNGGGLYLQGEKPVDYNNTTKQWFDTSYKSQDKSLFNFVQDLGGGTLQAMWDQNLWLPAGKYETVVPGPVSTNTGLKYSHDGALGVTDPGNGFFVDQTTERRIEGTWPPVYETGKWSNLIGFDFGDLTMALDSRLILNFDVTKLSSNTPDGFNINQYLMGDVVTFLGTDSPIHTNINSPIATPEPSTIVYFMCAGGFGLLALRKRKSGIKNG